MNIPLPQPGQSKPMKSAVPDLNSLPTLPEKIEAVLKQIYDPEIPISIFELGLIYKVDIDESGKKVAIDMTLTTPNCPEAQVLPGRVREEVKQIPGLEEVDVKLVWDPPWDRDRMSDEAKLHLGLI